MRHRGNSNTPDNQQSQLCLCCFSVINNYAPLYVCECVCVHVVMPALQSVIEMWPLTGLSLSLRWRRTRTPPVWVHKRNWLHEWAGERVETAAHIHTHRLTEMCLHLFPFPSLSCWRGGSLPPVLFLLHTWSLFHSFIHCGSGFWHYLRVIAKQNNVHLVLGFPPGLARSQICIAHLSINWANAKVA